MRKSFSSWILWGYESQRMLNEVVAILWERTILLRYRKMEVKKTPAFGIPICERSICEEENKPQALILNPSKELAKQISEDITNKGRLKRINVTAVYGKQPFAWQQAELN